MDDPVGEVTISGNGVSMAQGHGLNHEMANAQVRITTRPEDVELDGLYFLLVDSRIGVRVCCAACW